MWAPDGTTIPRNNCIAEGHAAGTKMKQMNFTACIFLF